jgi:hypothetical protein
MESNRHRLLLADRKVYQAFSTLLWGAVGAKTYIGNVMVKAICEERGIRIRPSSVTWSGQGEYCFHWLGYSPPFFK